MIRQNRRSKLMAEADPYYNNTVLLLGMDGAPGGATFRDASPVPKNISVSGAVTYSAAQNRFDGRSSIYFDGSGGYLSVPDSSDWLFGTAFSIDFWVYLTGNGNAAGYNSIIGQREFIQAGAWYIHLMTSNVGGYGPAMEQRSGDVSVYFSCISANSAHSTTQNAWHHIAASYDGALVRVFQDGAMTASAAYTNAWADASGVLSIGHLPSTSEKMQGHIADLRITKGVCRYKSDFTPPQYFPTE